MEEKILEIIKKWYIEHRHGHFTLFKDKDQSNDLNHNLEYIEIKEAFNDRNKVFNWTEGLNRNEIIFVEDYWEYFKEYFKRR